MLSKRNILALVVLIVILSSLSLLTYYVTTHNDARDSQAADILGTDEEIIYKTLDGEEVSFEEYEGVVRVVNSWASWTPYSRAELEDLNRLAAAYAGENVKVIAINRNEDPVRARLFLNQVGNLEHLTILVDDTDAFYARMGGQAMPETLFFDANGNIVTHARGNLNYVQMEEYLKAALAAQ